MKTLLLVAGLLLSTSAFAHLEPGKYVGTTREGHECTFEVLAIRFEGARHPLNERVDVRTGGGIAMTLSHLPKIDVEAKAALADKDHLTGATGIPGGAFGIVLTMVHSEELDGPKEIAFVSHDYKKPEASVAVVCGGLKHVAE
jgi:hypothetical protein